MTERHSKSDDQILLIIQARMGATRLPGKPLKKVLGRPLLDYLYERVKHSTLVKSIVLATTTNPKDDEIAQYCHSHRYPFIRGSEEDVLDRFNQTIQKFDGDIIVRVTADCPLIDPAVIDKVIEHYIHHFPQYDYVSNTIRRTYPRGMDVEVFSRKCLETAAKETSDLEDREHVTPFIYRHPNRFSLGSVVYGKDISHYRWTVDTPEDFQLVEKIITNLYPEKKHFALKDIIHLLEKHPEWSNINAHIKQKEISQ